MTTGGTCWSGGGRLGKILEIDLRDGLAALFVLLIGAFGIADALTHNFGTMRNIGPGAFPLIVSILILASGIWILVESWRAQGDVEASGGSSPRVIAFVVAGMLAFALLAQQFGIGPGIFACVVLSAMAEGKLKWWQMLLLATVLTGFCALVFITFLNLPLRLISF